MTPGNIAHCGEYWQWVLFKLRHLLEREVDNFCGGLGELLCDGVDEEIMKERGDDVGHTWRIRSALVCPRPSRICRLCGRVCSGDSCATVVIVLPIEFSMA